MSVSEYLWEKSHVFTEALNASGEISVKTLLNAQRYSEALKKNRQGGLSASEAQQKYRCLLRTLPAKAWTGLGRTRVTRASNTNFGDPLDRRMVPPRHANTRDYACTLIPSQGVVRRKHQ